MRLSLGIRGRLALAIVLTAVIPLVAAVVLARNMVRQTAQRFFVPEVRQNIERSLDLYGELAKATKANMRLQAAAFATDGLLRDHVQRKNFDAARRRLGTLLQQHPDLVSLSVEDDSGTTLAQVDRGKPVDEQHENQLVVTQSLGTITGAPAHATTRDADAGAPDSAHEAKTTAAADDRQLVAVFATDKARFDAFGKMGEFVAAYSKLEARRDADEQTYVVAFAALLGITIILASGVGSRLAVGVTRRASELARATRLVAQGDLSIRVHEDAKDELGDLARAFNRMLREVETSRDRIEYLSRLASWQEMARRLAHEIKNPLTPIVLAMQEVHERLGNLSAEQKQFLDSALEIVETEVQTLRRLVGEFSEFARLPESHMEQGDLVAFLRELQRELELTEGRPSDDGRDRDGTEPAPQPHFDFDLLPAPALAHIDRQMMRRALVNLVSNATQAARGVANDVQIRVSLKRQQDYYELLVDDDGPGVPQALRSQVFEPYVTTKHDGTGLGLAIVKKIVIEHRGHIEMLESPKGGARVRILLPLTESGSTKVLRHSGHES